MTIVRGLSLASFWLLVQVTTAQAQNQNQPQTQAGNCRAGVLVMAHGGKDEWEAGVLKTVAPLREIYPLEVAFGMADATSLQEGVDRLEAQGASNIAVVRLFISGESWYERTRQILGLQPGAPERPQGDAGEARENGQNEGHAMGPRMAFWQLDSDATFTMSEPGLADAEEMAGVLLDRASDLSESSTMEDVLVLAHGTEDDAENRRWLEKMDRRAQRLRLEGGFHRVQVATLREDWPDKREAAKAAVREFVETSNSEGRTPLIIPYRVFGFGPYAEILEGLEHRSDGRGLTPHPAVAQWIEEQAAKLHAHMGCRD